MSCRHTNGNSMLQMRKPSLAFTALSLTLVALLLSGFQLVSGGTLERVPGNSAALKQILGDSATPANLAGTSDYLAGVAAYYQGDYIHAIGYLQAAEPSYGPFALHWLALSLEQKGDPRAALAVLASHVATPSPYGDAELSLYGDILLRTWDTAQTAQKQHYLELIQQRRREWLLPYAERLVNARHTADAEAWVQASAGYSTSLAALITLGRAALYQNNMPLAEDWFRQAYALRQTRETAYWYGLSLALGSAPAQGVQYLRQAIAVTAGDHPELSWMYQMLAIGAARSGDCAAAGKAFDQAAAIDPSSTNQAQVTQLRTQYQASCPQ